MSYLGNTPTQQNFVAGADQFSGTGSQTVFTLSRVVNTVFDIFVTVSNVPQDPFTAYTISGNTLTFDSAPPSGTNNIDVVYRATNVQTFVPSPGVSQQFAIGTAASPAITFIGDTNTGIFSPAADTVAIGTGGAEALRVNSSQNVGIGTSSPESISNFRFLDVGSSGTNQGVIQANNGTVKTAIYTSGVEGYVATRTNHNLNFQVNGNNQAGITTAGLFQFNSGYGSVATAYGCRAWVNFNGTGTVAIRASGNVSSITDGGVGIYTVNFTTAMPDANYCPVGIASGSTQIAQLYDATITKTTSGYGFATLYPSSLVGGGAAVDSVNIQVAIFR